MTRQTKVYDALRFAWANGYIITTMNDGVHRTRHPCDQGWVDGHVLCHPQIGGSEGLRRLRELRADGHRIERRHHPDKDRTDNQYRLVPAERLPL
jgi:hypothetical protein